MTGLPTTNASLLDEATASAEAVALATRTTKRNKVIVDSFCHPQNLDVIKTRSDPLGIDIEVCDAVEGFEFDEKVAAVVVQYPNTEGRIHQFDELIEKAHKNKSLVIMVCDLLSLTILRSPGDLGADIAVGSAQRFGVPLGYGGPHAGFMAVAKNDSKNALGRNMPGRIIGVTK